MPNVYFYQKCAGNHGVLRAVLSWEQANQVVSICSCFFWATDSAILPIDSMTSRCSASKRTRRIKSGKLVSTGLMRA